VRAKGFQTAVCFFNLSAGHIIRSVFKSSLGHVKSQLFLNFHFFPAAMQFPFATTGHNKFCPAYRANVSFTNLICHVFKYLPSDFTEKSGQFFPQIFYNSGMNYQSRLQRDLKALGIVAKEQAVAGTRLRLVMLT
jgi:hypothetical protein